jgi:hypothetical protein
MYAVAKNFVPFHHDPSHNDAMLDHLLDNAKRQFTPACGVCAGYEGAIFEVGSKT